MSKLSDIAVIYRGQIIRAVIGVRPAILARVADLTALDRICAYLAECEQAIEILRAKGYGKPGQTLVEMANELPETVAPRQDVLDIWTSR